MLSGKTPRECAADPALKADVIGWLKTWRMQASTSQLKYDFSWMWDELHLERDDRLQDVNLLMRRHYRLFSVAREDSVV